MYTNNYDSSDRSRRNQQQYILYLVGFVIFLFGAGGIAYLAGVDLPWIIAAAVALIGLGVALGATRVLQT